jgi:hypothetical protein
MHDDLAESFLDTLKDRSPHERNHVREQLLTMLQR